MPSDDTRPIPDPTFLTTQQLLRELTNLKEVMFARLDAMDKAIILLQDTANRSPTINEVFLQHEERFTAIGLQFRERDVRSERESRDNKVAVDAAFAAQKEAAAKQDEANQKAIDKSEKATNDSINKLGEVVKASTQALADKIDDVKGRLTAMESRTKGGSEVWGLIVGLIGVAGVITGIVIALTRH